MTPDLTMEKKKMKKHVFILSGQSNMSGRGGVKDRMWDGIVPQCCHPHPSILRFTAASQWEEAHEPLHGDIDASKTCGIGPGIAFAKAIKSEMGTDEPIIGLVPCAVGGTVIKEWVKGSRLYEEMVRRAKEAVEGEDGGGEIRAVLWFQGESDTLSDESAEAYSENMKRLIRDVRSDLNLPFLPFIQVAIASGEERLIEKIRKAQMALDLPNVTCVDAKGLPMNEDNLHLSSQAQVLLGHLLADSYIKHFLAPTKFVE